MSGSAGASGRDFRDSEESSGCQGGRQRCFGWGFWQTGAFFGFVR